MTLYRTSKVNQLQDEVQEEEDLLDKWVHVQGVSLVQGLQGCPGQIRICNGAEWSWSDSEMTSGRWLLPMRHLLTVCRTSMSLMFGSKVVILCSYWGLVLLGSSVHLTRVHVQNDLDLKDTNAPIARNNRREFTSPNHLLLAQNCSCRGEQKVKEFTSLNHLLY